MGTPSPELKQLWIRVLKRVHPDLAIDEQDRIRCERLTKLANAAYQAGNIEALKAVLRPSQVSIAEALRIYTASGQRQQATPPPVAKPRVRQSSPEPDITAKRSFKSWFWLSKFSPGTAFAGVILIWIGFSVYSVRPTRHAVTPAQVDNVKAPVQAQVKVTDAVDTTVGASREGSATRVSLSTTSGHPSLDPSCLNSAREAGTFGPSDGGSKDSLNAAYDCSYELQDRQLKTGPPLASSVEPSRLYMEQMHERLYQSFSNYERVDANVPAGNSAEMWFDVNRDGSVSNVRVGKPSGWDSLDYACVRAVERTETVGALPEDYKLRTLPAAFTCTYTGSNALLTSRPVDSATDRSNLYVGSVRNTAHE